MYAHLTPPALILPIAAIDPTGVWGLILTYVAEVGPDLLGLSPDDVIAELNESAAIMDSPTGAEHGASYTALADAPNAAILITVAASVCGWHLDNGGQFFKEH